MKYLPKSVQLPSGLIKMKTVLALGCLAFALVGASILPSKVEYKVKNGMNVINLI